MKLLFELFAAFFTIGGMTFGGGLAMLPMLEREVVSHHKWATREELMDCYAISQCTPGVIAVNTATFVGYRTKGIPGGIVATLGVITPSLIIITAIAMVLQHFMEIVWVQNAFAGIRVAVSALIVTSAVRIFRQNVKAWWHVALAVMAFIVVGLLGQSPVIVVVACAVLSFIFGKKVEAK